MNVPVTQAGAPVACAQHTLGTEAAAYEASFFALALPALNQSPFALPDDCSMLHFFLALTWSDASSSPTYYFLSFSAETLYWSAETTNDFCQYNSTSLKKTPNQIKQNTIQ